MSDRYLWDKSGPPDPQVERLERLLSPLADPGAPLVLPAEAPARIEAPRAAARRPILAWSLAAAAVLVVAAGVALLLPARGWRVQTIAVSAPIMMTTSMSSISVKPLRDCRLQTADFNFF